MCRWRRHIRANHTESENWVTFFTFENYFWKMVYFCMRCRLILHHETVFTMATIKLGVRLSTNRYIFGRTFFKITFLRIHIYYVILHFDILFSNWFFGVCSFTSAEKFLSSWKDSSQGTYVRLLETGSDITTSVLVLVLFICLVFFLLLHAFQVHWYQLYLFVCWRIVL